MMRVSRTSDSPASLPPNRGPRMLGRRFRFNLVQTILWTLGGGLILFALWGSVLTLQQGRLSAETWQSLIIAGIALGSVYGLIALGYTLVYGILFMINFAHGEVFMWGTFTAWFMATGLNDTGIMDASPVLAFLLVLATAMFISMLVAVMLERIAYRPRGAPPASCPSSPQSARRSSCSTRPADSSAPVYAHIQTTT